MSSKTFADLLTSAFQVHQAAVSNPTASGALPTALEAVKFAGGLMQYRTRTAEEVCSLRETAAGLKDHLHKLRTLRTRLVLAEDIELLATLDGLETDLNRLIAATSQLERLLQ
mgnify:CR=1 FL=1